MEKYVHKLTRSHNSYYLVIPKEILEKYGYRERQKFIVEDKGKGIIQIKDWKKRR